jgi:hypothetical protein
VKLGKKITQKITLVEQSIKYMPMTIRFIALIAFFLFSSVTWSKTFEIKTTPSGKLNYPYIAHISSGPAYGHESGDLNIRGRYLRLLIIDGSTVYIPTVLRIEQYTYGDEACCRSLVTTREVDITQALMLIAGEYSPANEELRILRCLSSTKVEIKYNKFRFSLLDLDK